ncbi:MAG: LptF/LptG family permease [Treponema lecithinolyticum]|uniref:LptF/LptG family permease n=1 Tax=Treponema lecithinolyticum TaxID=53418 RepID=UPI0036141DEC
MIGIFADIYRVCRRSVLNAALRVYKTLLPYLLPYIGRVKRFRAAVRMKHVLFSYILRELLLYFIVAFLFFFLIFFVNHMLLRAGDILEKRVPLGKVALFIFYSLPFVIAQSAPFATLVGFLMCIGRMVTDNEFLIIRSAGHSPLFFMLPVVLLGLLISVFSFAVNDYLLPLGTISYNKLYLSIIVSNPAVELEPHSIKRTQNSTLVIGDVSKRSVSDLLLFDTDSAGNQRIVVAAGADIQAPEDDAVIMRLDMKKALVIFFDAKRKDFYDFLRSDKAVLNIFSSSFLPSYKNVNPQELTSHDLKIKLKEMKENSNSANELLLNSYKLEYHRKFSLPFGSLFFALLAFPLAAVFGKRNGQTAGLIIGVVIAVFYWALMILGQQFGLRNGFNGFWSMWIPNILTFVCALLFYIKLVRS